MILTYTLPQQAPQRFETESDAIVIGRRPSPEQHVDLELEADTYVSHMHTRISLEDGTYWVRDLGSANGTWIDGTQINEKTRLFPGSTVQIGYTVIVVQMDPTAGPEEIRPAPDADLSSADLDATTINPVTATEDTGSGIDDIGSGATMINPQIMASLKDPAPGVSSASDDQGKVVDAADMTIHSLIGSGGDTVDEVLMQSWRQMASFNALVQGIDAAENLDDMVQVLVENLQRAIPNALRGAILLPDKGEELLLKAHWPAGDLSVSNTWVRRAVEQKQAFIWAAPAGDETHGDLPQSAVTYSVRCAIYVPLMIGDAVLGVMVVDNYYDREAFSATDLEFLKAVGHQVALFIKNRLYRRDQRQEEMLLSRLSHQFSPKVFELIMQKGDLPDIGGERIDPVTILVSDVRGFTALSRNMRPDDVVRMLNEMFDAFVPIIFENDGIVDKYVGDSVLAVFGSPEPDDHQWEKAVRAALDMQQAVQKLGEGRRVRRLPVFKVGISIHTGAVIHGFIGAAERTEYTVVGDTVNLASRYCDGADAGEIVISKAVYERVYRLVTVNPKTIVSKHANTEPDLPGYVVEKLKPT